MRRLDSKDFESLEEEVSEMKQVLKWLDKRIKAENDIGCSTVLCEARKYVESSLKCFEADIKFMDKRET